MYYVGLDVHQRTSTYCILNGNGKVVKRKTVAGPWQRVVGELGKDRKRFRAMSICFEASCGYGPLYDGLASFAKRVIMAHPGQLRLIFRSKRKNDRIDAKKLATLLYLDQVPPSHVPSENVRHWRQLIEFRRRMVDKQTATKNQIRALLRSVGIAAVKGLWTCKGLAWLEGLPWSSALLQTNCDMLLESYHVAIRQIRTVTKQLDQVGRRHPGVTLLQTIPGVGPRTAETIVAYIDRIERFARTGQVGAYFGLTPSQDSSAGINRLGHITKQGPGTARKYLVEAAWQAIRRCPAARERYQRICKDRRDRRKTALVATAHWLLRCMVAMLRTGEPWRDAA
jgi:transposase